MVPPQSIQYPFIIRTALISVLAADIGRFSIRRTGPIVSRNPFRHSTVLFDLHRFPQSPGVLLWEHTSQRCAQPPIPVGNIFTLGTADRSLSKGIHGVQIGLHGRCFALVLPGAIDRPPLRPPHRRKLRLDSGTASIRHVREILLLDEIKKRCHRNATIPLYLLLGAVTFPWSSIEPSMDGTSRVLVRSGCYIRRSRSRVEVKSVGVIRRNG